MKYWSLSNKTGYKISITTTGIGNKIIGNISFPEIEIFGNILISESIPYCTREGENDQQYYDFRSNIDLKLHLYNKDKIKME